jgi:7-cyano-7-deazaguanine synthase
MEVNRTILLISGGLDSSSLLFWALHRGYEVLPLFVDYGQATQPAEWQAVCALLELAGLSACRPVSLPNVASLGTGSLSRSTSHMPKYFPSRNLLLVTLAAIHAYANNVSHIMIGLIADTASSLPDCSIQFIENLQSLLSIEHPQLTIEAPFIERYKAEIVQEAIVNGLKPEITFSCNRLANHHCWTCPSCLDRLRVLRDLGFVDAQHIVDS